MSIPSLETIRPSLNGYSSGWLTDTNSNGCSSSGVGNPATTSIVLRAASRAHSRSGTNVSRSFLVGTL